MSMWCDNPREHERDGRSDFERHGRYGYDHQHYQGHGDCDKHYTRGFDEAKREHERIEEQREEEQRQESQRHREEHRRRERMDEEEYYERERYEEYCREQEALEANHIANQFVQHLNWSKKRRVRWLRRKGFAVV